MRVGLLSDAHGRAPITGRAVRALRDAGADLLLYLGDVGSEAVIDELVGHPARLVFGNCDLEIEAFTRYARLVDVQVDHPAGRLDVEGRSAVFTHGHLDGPIESALREGVDYLFLGHSHQVRDERIGPTRIVNPGALFRAARYTAALVDMRRDTVSFIELPKD